MNNNDDARICLHCKKTKNDHYYDHIFKIYACRFGGVIAVICTYNPIESEDKNENGKIDK
jgi:hypothetical protein